MGVFSGSAGDVNRSFLSVEHLYYVKMRNCCKKIGINTLEIGVCDLYIVLVNHSLCTFLKRPFFF